MTKEEIREFNQKYKIIAVANRLGLPDRLLDESLSVAYCVHCPNSTAHQNNDKNPSLALLPKANRFNCYGCGQYGDVINLVQLTLGCDFREAVLWLDPDAKLDSSSRKIAKDYLKEKGFTLETLKKFSVFTGEGWDNGKKYECVYFPIPTGMKYRLFECPNHKYKNGIGAGACLFKTVENPPDELLILCEGEFDAMIGWQNTGYPFWTSTAGTMSFESKWVDELKKFKKIIIGFDNDEGGRDGAASTINILVRGGIDRKRIVQIEVPETMGKDWCDYFSAGMTKKDFDELINIASDREVEK